MKFAGKRTKFRRCLSLFMAALLGVYALPFSAIPVRAAAGGEGNGAAAISEAFDPTYLFATKATTLHGLHVTIKSYADKTQYAELGAKNPTETARIGGKYETIIYVIGHNVERIGRESDVSILQSYLDEGYIVLVADFGGDPEAKAGKLEAPLYDIKQAVAYSNQYVGALGSKRSSIRIKKEIVFVFFAGYRIERNVPYFDLLKNGTPGTADRILAAWNDTHSSGFKATKSSKIPACEWNGNKKGVWYEATHVEQLVRPDPITGKAIPLDFELGLTIIYPSDPVKKTPVHMNSSSWEQREGGMTASKFLEGFQARGFTVVSYDHEYHPMAREDHYGYFLGGYGYGLANYIGARTHSAAVRCVRALASTYGYSDFEGYSVQGMSKACYCSILGSGEPNDRADLAAYPTPILQTQSKDGFVYGSLGQPNTVYPEGSPKAGEAISSRVQGVCAGMGAGTDRAAEIVNEDTSPSVIVCGIMDQFGSWDRWAACQKVYMDCDVTHLAISMYDLGHKVPQGIDTIYNYERGQAMMDFLAYNANIEDIAPSVIYTYPYDGTAKYKGEEPIIVHFTGAIPMEEVEKGIRIIDKTIGVEMTGSWTASAGNAKYEFTPAQPFTFDHTYHIEIAETLKDCKGMSISNPGAREFRSTADIMLPASLVSTLENGETVETKAETLTVTNENGLYLVFDRTKIDKDSTTIRLALDVKNEASNQLMVYAAEGNQNAPTRGALIGEIDVTDSGICSLNLGEYLSTLEGDSIRLIVMALHAAANSDGYAADFEGECKKATNSDNQIYSTEFGFRAGGAPKALSLSTDQNRTAGGKTSFKVERQHEYDRVKFYNSFKREPLTEADIGSTYKVTAYAYAEAPMSLTLGVMSATGDSYATRFYGTTSTTTLKKGEWTKCELTYTIEEGNIEEQIGMLVMQGTTTCTFYIDDIKVEKNVTHVEIGGPSAQSGISPSLLLDKTPVTVLVGNVGYETLADAIAAVPLDGKPVTVTLLGDVTLSTQLVIKEKMNVTLDLCGYTIDASSEGGAPISVQGKLRMMNGKIIDNTRGASNARTTIHVKGTDASLVLDDLLRIKSNADYSAIRVGSAKNSKKQQGALTILGGVEIDAFWYAVDAYPDGAVDIKGGDFTNTQNDILLRFQSSDSGYYAPHTISGGYFTTVAGSKYDLIQKSTSLKITGGEFSELVQPGFLANGYICDDVDGDGVYTVIPDPATLKITGTTLILDGDSISLGYMVKKSVLEGITDPYIEFEWEGGKCIVEDYTEKGDYYRFTLGDISIHELTKGIKSTLCASAGGGILTGETREYSVATYCERMLKKHTGDEHIAFRTLLVDLLMYGTAAQNAQAYKTDDLANARLDDESRALATVKDENAPLADYKKAYFAAIAAYAN